MMPADRLADVDRLPRAGRRPALRTPAAKPGSRSSRRTVTRARSAIQASPRWSQGVTLHGAGVAEIVEPAGDPVGAQLDLRVALEHEVDVDQVVLAGLGRDRQQRQLLVGLRRVEAAILDLVDLVEHQRGQAFGQPLAGRPVGHALAPIAGERAPRTAAPRASSTISFNELRASCRQAAITARSSASAARSRSLSVIPASPITAPARSGRRPRPASPRAARSRGRDGRSG